MNRFVIAILLVAVAALKQRCEVCRDPPPRKVRSMCYKRPSKRKVCGDLTRSNDEKSGEGLSRSTQNASGMENSENLQRQRREPAPKCSPTGTQCDFLGRAGGFTDCCSKVCAQQPTDPVQGGHCT